MAKQKTNKKNTPEPRKSVFNKKFFITYFLLFIATFFLSKSCEKQRLTKEKQEKEIKIKDSIAKVKEDSIQKLLKIVKTENSEVDAGKIIGDFAYNLTIDSTDTPQDVTFENDLLKVVIAAKGGYFKIFELKKFKTYDSLPLLLVNDNAHFNLVLKTRKGQSINTKDMDFHASVSKQDENTRVAMKMYAGPDKYLVYEYIFKPNDYMFDFNISSKNLDDVLQSGDVPLHWDLLAYRHEKSISYENRFVTCKYEYEDDKIDNLSAMKSDEDEAKDVNWIDYKQHFFSTFLISEEKPFSSVKFKQADLAKSGEDSLKVTKQFFTDTALKSDNGNLSYQMKMFYGPNDYKMLRAYDMGIERVIPLGWTIFGWVNKWLFMPLFSFLSSFIPNYGVVIILMTIIIRLLVSPLTYKTYVSQARSKILKPEIEDINKKYKDNAAKRQKEVMALQSKAGVSPMAGCIPSLLFIPIFYALFRFFPAEIGLRQKGFLWAHDLSAYESIAHLPFKIPMYGDHVSLLALLASIAMFVYMKMNMSNQTAMPTQEGMPDMQKMMKWMIYLSPVMLLVFFNSYASGLSLYYFISNLMTIVILVVIKKYVIDENRLKEIIEENKKKPKKQGRFAKKMADMMEKAEEQKKLQAEAKKNQGRKKK